MLTLRRRRGLAAIRPLPDRGDPGQECMRKARAASQSREEAACSGFSRRSPPRVSIALGAPAKAQAQQTKELTLWTHWAAEQIKRAICRGSDRRIREEQSRRQDQGILVRKDRALCGAEDRDCAPDRRRIFSTPSPTRSSTSRTTSCSICRGLNWANIEPWAKQAWSYKGKPYGLPLEAWTQSRSITTRN